MDDIRSQRITFFKCQIFIPNDKEFRANDDIDKFIDDGNKRGLVIHLNPIKDLRTVGKNIKSSSVGNLELPLEYIQFISATETIQNLISKIRVDVTTISF